MERQISQPENQQTAAETNNVNAHEREKQMK